MNTSKAVGKLSKTITVNTNISGANSKVLLKLTGEVWQPVQVTPVNASFGRITADKAEEGLVRKLTIQNNLDGTMMKPGKIVISNSAYKAAIKTLEEGKKYEMTVTLVPPLKKGNNTGKITLDTGIPESPKLQISTYAYVTAAVDVTPQKLTLNKVRSAGIKRQFYVRSNSNIPLKITDLKASNPDIKLELTDIRKSLTFRITADIPASYSPPAGGDQITFKTDNPAARSMTIPIVLRPTGPVRRVGNTTIRSIGNPPQGRTLEAALGQAKAKAKAQAKAASPPKAKQPKKAPAGN